MGYDHKRPRRVNLVSGFLTLVAAAAIYLGVKFLPVYWQNKKVDHALDETAVKASTFGRLTEDSRRAEAAKLVDAAIASLHDLGVEDQLDQPIQVWFSPEYDELHARYTTIVQHNFGTLIKPTVLSMHRVVRVPR